MVFYKKRENISLRNFKSLLKWNEKDKIFKSKYFGNKQKKRERESFSQETCKDFLLFKKIYYWIFESLNKKIFLQKVLWSFEYSH